jgi:hypothetical protein
LSILQFVNGTSTQTIDIQEIAVVVTAESHSSTLLNIDFLKASGIIPIDWEMDSPPVCTAEGSQIIFQNQVNLVALPDRIHFSEVIGGKPVEEICIFDIAQKYIKTLPNLNYQAVGINPRGHVAFPDRAAARQYISKTFLTPGSWQTMGQVPAKVSLRLSYTPAAGNLFLGIEEGMLRSPEHEIATPAVMFSANFNYNVTNDADGVQQVNQLIDRGYKDLEVYRDLINHRFLGVAI